MFEKIVDIILFTKIKTVLLYLCEEDTGDWNENKANKVMVHQP